MNIEPHGEEISEVEINPEFKIMLDQDIQARKI